MNKECVCFISFALSVFNLINNDVNLLTHAVYFIMLFKVLMSCITISILSLIE